MNILVTAARRLEPRAVADAITRRTGRSLMGPVLILLLAVAFPVHALEKSVARDHVDATIGEIIQLIVDDRPRAETAQRLLDIVEKRASIDAVARFAAGRYWRGMSESQKAAFGRAFSRHVASIYAGYFRRYEGEVADLRRYVHIRGTEDAGPKGILVRTEVVPVKGVPISIDWLVSDRAGRVGVADLIVEGISMAITQREVVGAMLDARGGDIDQLVSDLEQGTAAP